LVPSRYALRVGEIDALVISDGVFPLPVTTLATNADAADLAAWLDDRIQPPDVATSHTKARHTRQWSLSRSV
jgi:hypothetical protein